VDDVDFAGWTLEQTIQVIQDDRRTRVLVKGRPYMSWPSGDENSVRMAMVQLSGCGLGTQEELAKVFGVHVNSVQRYLRDFERQGMGGLLSGRSGPKKRWKLTPELRGKILLIVLREGIGKLEAIQQRLAEAWQEQVSVASIQQVLAENGLGELPVRPIGAEAVTGELFGMEPERQLTLNLAAVAQAAWEAKAESSEPPSAEGGGSDPGSDAQAGEGDEGRDYRRNYSPAQRVYLDQLEQGDYNMLAGCCLRRCWRAMIFLRRCGRGLRFPPMKATAWRS